MNLIYFRSFARASSILYKRLNNFSTRNVTNSIISPSVRISKLFENDGPIKISEWNNIRMSFLQTENSTENNVDHLILDFCERNNQAIDNALSYVDFLKVNQIYTNVQLQSKVIKLCCQKLKSESILPSQETKIIKLCQDLIDSTATLNKATVGHILDVLTMTTEWKKSINIIEKYNIQCCASTLSAFSLIAANAFWEDQPEIGWKMLNKISETLFFPNCISFMAYWDYCNAHADELKINIEKMLTFIGDNHILVSKIVIDKLQYTLDTSSIAVSITKVNFRGECQSCKKNLASIDLSTLEFQTLKKEFEKTSLNKEMILEHSTPSELIRFKQHVNKKRKFDYVIDGLNTAHAISASTGNLLKQSKHLAEVVEHFVKRKKRLLVIGRKHMETWPDEQHLNYIKKNATVFLTADKSDDDSYLLYAALISGDKTGFVSCDQMKTYALRLNPSARILFKRWQKQNQNFVIYNDRLGSFKIQSPLKYKSYAHENATGEWHVPFVVKPVLKLGVYPEYSIQWACFKLNSNNTHNDNCKELY